MERKGRGVMDMAIQAVSEAQLGRATDSLGSRGCQIRLQLSTLRSAPCYAGLRRPTSQGSKGIPGGFVGLDKQQ